MSVYTDWLNKLYGHVIAASVPPHHVHAKSAHASVHQMNNNAKLPTIYMNKLS